jgi:hypothetical protein
VAADQHDISEGCGPIRGGIFRLARVGSFISRSRGLITSTWNFFPVTASAWVNSSPIVRVMWAEFKLAYTRDLEDEVVLQPVVNRLCPAIIPMFH